jgi:hypothetical protein
MIDEVTPAEMLATLTVDQLIAAGLVRADKRDTTIAAVASGNMKTADWKNEIDLASEKANPA